MSANLSKSEGVSGLISEFGAENVVNSVVLNSVQGSTISVYELITQDIPQGMQHDGEIQRILAELRETEGSYLAAYQAQRMGSSLLPNPETMLWQLVSIVYIMGLAFILLPNLIVLGLAIVIGVLALIFFAIVRFRTGGILKRNANTRKAELLKLLQLFERRRSELAL